MPPAVPESDGREAPLSIIGTAQGGGTQKEQRRQKKTFQDGFSLYRPPTHASGFRLILKICLM
jgi:hypothetical protein